MIETKSIEKKLFSKQQIDSEWWGECNGMWILAYGIIFSDGSAVLRLSLHESKPDKSVDSADFQQKMIASKSLLESEVAANRYIGTNIGAKENASVKQLKGLYSDKDASQEIDKVFSFFVSRVFTDFIVS